MSDRDRWFDDTGRVLLDEKVMAMETVKATLADGFVDADELDAQEARLTEVMRRIEPQLDDNAHRLVTELICELSAYGLMQTMHGIWQAREALAGSGS